MTEQEVNIRLYYNGVFKKTTYSGGLTLGLPNLDPDEFSYTVLMEHVKDFLCFSEIRGVYILNKKGRGWKLLTEDKEVMDYVNGCQNGKEIHFYLDNFVDKEIEPLIQMQPHVVIRPRKNLIEVSGKKPLKRNFVTVHQIQQQQRIKMSKKLTEEPRKSPRLSKKPVLETTEHERATVNPRGTTRRKLNLQKDTGEGANTGENDIAVELPPVQAPSEYEQLRINHVQENKELFDTLGLGKYVANLKVTTMQESKGKEKAQEESDEYIVENESEDDSGDSPERIKSVKAKKIRPGPRTRLRANATIEKEATQAPTPTRKEVTSSFDVKLLKLTCNKLLRQCGNHESGSVAAYMALRERQKQNLEVDPRIEDIVESSLPNAYEEVKAAPKKPRGRTRMSKVHARSTDEKQEIILNARGQPVGTDRKVTTELSNFLGTLVKDHVPLTHVNWHVVPEELKKKMLEYTLDRYIIPEEGKKWLNKTFNSSWRVHKSRMKKFYYTKYNTDEERIRNKPDQIPLEDFKSLLSYWADEEVQTLSEKNAARRNSNAEPHTLGRKSIAHLRDNLDGIKEMMKEGKDADLLLSSGKSHGANWLVGRQGASSTATSSPGIPEPYVEQLTAKISRNLESEMEAKVTKKVQENMTWLLKKLGEANPGMKLDFGDYCATASSDQDDNGTPITQRGAT